MKSIVLSGNYSGHVLERFNDFQLSQLHQLEALSEADDRYYSTVPGRLHRDVMGHVAKQPATDKNYAGHLPGSGVQSHSAGGVFPWIVGAQEVGVGGHRFYFLITREQHHFSTYGAACDYAAVLLGQGIKP